MKKPMQMATTITAPKTAAMVVSASTGKGLATVKFMVCDATLFPNASFA
jgi:hypothetical protein